MRFRYRLVSMLSAALAFACGSEGPLIPVNQRITLSQGDVRQMIGGECFTVRVSRVDAPDPGGLTFYHPASLAPDLEVAVGWYREYLALAARTTGGMNQVARTLSVDYLMSHSHATMIVNRARVTDGAYEVETWGGHPQSAAQGCEVLPPGD